MKIIFQIYLFIHFTFLTFGQKENEIIVFFNSDSYVLNVKSKNEIDEKLRDGSFNKINIKTYCDSNGTIDYNKKLALKRAIAIKNYLLKHYINDTIFEIQAIGEELSKNNFENSSLTLNRRGEIHFEQIIPILNAVSKKSIEDSTLSKLDSDTAKIDSINNISPINEVNFDINKFEVGNVIKLDNINFYSARHVLLPESWKTLDLLYKILVDNPDLKIEIQGHVCCIESGDGEDFDTGTWNLSVNRAKEIYNILIKKGIQSSRLKYKGFGSKYKLVSESTELGRKLNRRVEIKILDK